ncbi:hypothetical protein FIBSPDRAFT_859520 [Athelia psychrophila]|uniref:BTB domain-containing protein n=1 Tax=Athelia psychrophila TaxID=1759441 RepID=A0A166L0Q4_9AGAM|nr:hypothetical protein FIBSPDRAFT_859520 [Fibularhizoctonia sp. CBS 109695]
MDAPALVDRVLGSFCKADSDISFRSRDGVTLKLHRKNLETSSEGFSPPAGTTSEHEIISLTESGEMLELLFRFIYPQRYPDLKDVEFKQLEKLSEAAEKYQVYSAMAVCNFRMEEAYHKHPFEVVMYVLRHCYTDLMDKSQTVALDVSPTLAFESFSPQVYIAWTRYYAQWMDLLASLHRSLNDIPHDSFHSATPHNHGVHQTNWFQWVMSQLDRPASLLRIESFFGEDVDRTEMSVCWDCKVHLQKWKDGEMKDVIASMRKLSEFL